jgi:hypothetical protein
LYNQDKKSYNEVYAQVCYRIAEYKTDGNDFEGAVQYIHDAYKIYQKISQTNSQLLYDLMLCTYIIYKISTHDHRPRKVSSLTKRLKTICRKITDSPLPLTKPKQERLEEIRNIIND